jgi:hypothetical protein
MQRRNISNPKNNESVENMRLYAMTIICPRTPINTNRHPSPNRRIEEIPMINTKR